MASLFPGRSALVPSSPFLVVIDGLDECQGHDDQHCILTQPPDIVNTHHLPLRFLVVGCPESHLCEAFEEPALENISEKLSLYHDQGDILGTSFRGYTILRGTDVVEFVPTPWPSNETINRLVSKLGGYFIYAVTVIKFIDEECFSPMIVSTMVQHT